MKSLETKSSSQSSETSLTKKCIDCGEVKSVSEFYKASNKIHYYSYCKECSKKRTAKFIKADPIAQMLRSAKIRAKKKGLDFTLTKEDIKIPNLCPILGIKLDWNGGLDSRGSSPSLDRIDNSKGYVPENIWIISGRANTIKNSGTAEEHRLIAAAMDDILASIERGKQLELDL